MSETLIRYDKESDVLYISFHDPPLAADFSNRVGDFLFRTKDGDPIGVTIMNFTHYEGVIKLLIEHLPQLKTQNTTPKAEVVK